MDQQALHREECLEAEVRKYRQALRILADAVLAGSDEAAALAEAAKDLLEDR